MTARELESRIKINVDQNPGADHFIVKAWVEWHGTNMWTRWK